jgi:tetratricopeptide (TPR) repeat protein
MKITKTTHILFIALIITIVFSNSLKNNFAWDDKYLIVDNPYLKDWRYFSKMFTDQIYAGDGLGSNFYRPLQLVSYAIDYHVWKLNPFGYHLTSLLLHIFNAALVYIIIDIIGMSPYIAFFTSLFFGIAPAISGITFYIPARSDLLMALFLFLSILSFVRYRENKKKICYPISILFFILSLLCKEAAAMLPLLLGLEIFKNRGKQKPSLKPLIPYAVVLLIYVIIRLTVLNFSKGLNPIIDYTFPASIPLWRRILTDFKIILMYLRILIFPIGLHMEWYVEPAKKIFQPDILLSILGVVFLIFALKKASRKYNNLVLFGGLWFLLSMLPVLNIYPISVFFGEGWLYIASVGFFIILSVIFKDIIEPKVGKILYNLFIALFLIYYAVFTICYGKVWKDSITVFNNILRYEPKNPFTSLTYNNLAISYYDMKEFEKSVEHCKKSIENNPSYSKPYNNMGSAYAALGKNIKAIKCFKKAISMERDYIFSYTNLSHAYNNIGLKDKAIQLSKIAINIDPESYEAHCNLGYMYLDKGNTDEAIKYFKKAAMIKRDNYEPHYCLGAIYMNNKNYKEALDEYNETLKLGLSDYDFYNKISAVYIKNYKFKEAEMALINSLALNKNQSGPHNNLGNLYSMFGKFDLAIGEYRKALDIEPGNKHLSDNIIDTKKEWKQYIKKSVK